MGILGLARKVVGGLAGSTPQAAQLYQVSCVAGHRLRGERTEGYQALRCPSCGDGLFVLPRSPLPEPPAPTERASVRSPVETDEPAWTDDDELIALTDPIPEKTSTGSSPNPDIDIEWEESPAPAPAPKAKPQGAESTSDASTKTRASRRRREDRPASPRPTAVRAPRPDFKQLARKHRTALLTIGVVSLVVGALIIREGRRRLELLPKVAERGRLEGLEKLDAGEFHVAKRILVEAAAAVDGLGGRVEGAEEIRQGAREAAIFTDLASESLERMVEEAATFRDVTAWSSHFKTMYQGRSIILDAPLVEAPDPSRPGSRYRIDYKIFLGKGPKPEGRARIDLEGFRLFEEARSSVGEQKPFGARLASLELDLEANEWAFRLEPRSGVFITHPLALEAIGWPAPESIEEARP
ncbi:hypothetical protein TA3x_003216 [Tundrisphaera sp. TA3]|uniref:hypothetical protein n=1 Tax=Tundrisphaera sp. TA3 TaxID=3435775 RepID=UPI003EBD719B